VARAEEALTTELLSRDGVGTAWSSALRPGQHHAGRLTCSLAGDVICRHGTTSCSSASNCSLEGQPSRVRACSGQLSTPVRASARARRGLRRRARRSARGRRSRTAWVPSVATAVTLTDLGVEEDAHPRVSRPLEFDRQGEQRAQSRRVVEHGAGLEPVFGNPAVELAPTPTRSSTRARCDPRQRCTLHRRPGADWIAAQVDGVHSGWAVSSVLADPRRSITCSPAGIGHPRFDVLGHNPRHGRHRLSSGAALPPQREWRSRPPRADGAGRAPGPDRRRSSRGSPSRCRARR